MADLAVGISKAAVEALVSKVQSAIKEDAEKWLTMQRDLVFITGEFEMMQSFLDTASEEHVKNNIVRTWVRQVRDLSNDVEDTIDFILHIDTAKRSWWLRLLAPCSGKTGALLPVDEAVAETTLLRARVVDVSQRNIRYNLISDSGSGSKLPGQVQQAAATPNLVIDAVKMQGGRSDLLKLINSADESLQVISVCGTGGDHGKISIIKNAYEDSVVCEKFRCRAWVKLTRSYNPLEIIQNFVSQFYFYTNFCQEQAGTIVGTHMLKMMQVTQEDLNSEFMEQVNKHRYLIIIEDISTMVQWHAIRSYLPDRKNGSRIIVSTQQLEIASLCAGQPYGMLEICQLSPDHSVCIFFKEGLQYDTDYSFTKDDNDSLVYVPGRDTEVNELFHQIQERRLIFLCGMPGVGKSVIIRSIFNNLKKSDKFENQAWINVRHPFNPRDFARTLLLSFLPEQLQAKDPIQECCRFLHEHKCLVVIDGLHSKEDWDWIKSNLTQHGHSGGRIIIITSDEIVAKHCAVSSTTDAVYNVKGLEPNAALELFEKAFKEKRQIIFTVEREAIYILSKCGGLPRVITTVARYLATKPTDVLQQELRRLSDNFMQELSTNPEFESLRGLLAWMHSYMDACPRHLKKYMLYLSIFPQDIIIRRRRLIRRWIAEGYSKGTDSISMEKYAEKIFYEVAALSVMQPVLLEASNKVVGYRVNSFFREYIMSRPAEETIFFPVEVSALEKQGHGRLATDGTGQHLAIGSTWERDEVVFESLDLSRLRSLTTFGFYLSFYVSDRMRVLRVLDLENAYYVEDDDFEQIGKLPSRLKFLSLRGQSGITRLPDSVGELLQLQTLDIRETKIATLPPFITKLRKLQYIRAGTTIAWTDYDIISSSDDAEEGPTRSSSWSRTLPSRCLPKKFLRRRAPNVGSRSCGIEVPRGIKGLEALQMLGGVYVNTADGEAILKEIIYSLPQLKKLEVSGISRKHGRLSLYHLDEKTHLESLSLQFDRNNHFVHWEYIYIPRSLRSLKMFGHVERLLRYIENCDNLVKLTLEMTTLFTPDVIKILGSIPNLQTLRLRVSKDQDGELQFPSTEHFRELQVLEIACKSKLHVTFDEGSMEKLEHLKLHCLRGSVMQVSGLERPPSLKRVWLLGFFDDALREALQEQLGRHQKIPAPKLKVPREDDDA